MESLCTQHNMKCGLAGSWSSQLRLVECSKALAAFSIHLQVIKSFTLLNRASMYIWGFDLLIIGDQLYVGQQCIHLWSLGFWPSHSWGSAWSSWPPKPRRSCSRWGPSCQLPARLICWGSSFLYSCTDGAGFCSSGPGNNGKIKASVYVFTPWEWCRWREGRYRQEWGSLLQRQICHP